MTDQELLRAYLDRRDVDCFDRFVRRYQSSLVRFAAKLLGDPDAAQDVVQEAFLRVARHPRRLLGVDSCHNWLLRVVRNVGVDHVRRASRYRKHAEQAAAVRDRHAIDHQESPAAGLERAETRALIEKEVGRLKPIQRELFWLKVSEGKSYREIAEITGMTATNVGYHLHQVLRTLAHRLDSTQQEEWS